MSCWTEAKSTDALSIRSPPATGGHSASMGWSRISSLGSRSTATTAATFCHSRHLLPQPPARRLSEIASPKKENFRLGISGYFKGRQKAGLDVLLALDLLHRTSLFLFLSILQSEHSYENAVEFSPCCLPSTKLFTKYQSLQPWKPSASKLTLVHINCWSIKKKKPSTAAKTQH